MKPPDSDDQEVKYCYVCGNRVYRRKGTFCSMKCVDANKRNTAEAVVREVAVLMRQYSVRDWAAVDQQKSHPEVV